MPGLTIGTISVVCENHPVADYEPVRSRAAADFVESIHNGMDPGCVAETILDSVWSDLSGPRYPVGGQARAVGLLRRLLPVRAFQALVRCVVRPR